MTAKLGHRDLTLGKPSAPAVLTPDEAVAAAQKVFAAQLFSHPYTVEYGSFVSGLRTRRDDSEPWRTVGLRDVWKITITDVNIPTPGGRRPGSKAPILYMHTFVIFVDDETGRFLEATNF